MSTKTISSVDFCRNKTKKQNFFVSKCRTSEKRWTNSDATAHSLPARTSTVGTVAIVIGCGRKGRKEEIKGRKTPDGWMPVSLHIFKAQFSSVMFIQTIYWRDAATPTSRRGSDSCRALILSYYANGGKVRPWTQQQSDQQKQEGYDRAADNALIFFKARAWRGKLVLRPGHLQLATTQSGPD